MQPLPDPETLPPQTSQDPHTGPVEHRDEAADVLEAAERLASLLALAYGEVRFSVTGGKVRYVSATRIVHQDDQAPAPAAPQE